jgi:integrase
MASIKVVLRKEEKQDGTYPLALRITKERKTSYVYLNYSILPKDWNAGDQVVKKSHPNSARLNNYLAKKLSEARNSALDIETKDSGVSVRAVRHKIKPAAGATFFPQANDYLETLKKDGKFNRYSPEKPRIGHFREFLKDQDIAFTDITPGLLNRFATFLRNYHISKEKKKPMSERTVINHLAVIRSVYAHARRNKVVTKEQSPFGGDDGIKIVFPDSTKKGLPVDDIQKLETVVLDDQRLDHARNIWLIAFYFAGMRISDVLRLRWSDFNNGRLHYLMGKNDKGGSLLIPEQALTILTKYRTDETTEDDLVFPDLKDADFSNEFETQRIIGVRVRVINQALKAIMPIAGLKEKPEPHKARHSFGSLAGDAIPIQMLQKLYRHTHVSTTIGYQNNFVHQATDDALNAVIGKVANDNKASIPATAGTFELHFKMGIEIIVTKDEFDTITDCISTFHETSWYMEDGEFWHRNIQRNKNAEPLHYTIEADIRELDAIVLKALESNHDKPKAKALSGRLFPVLKQAIAARLDMRERYKRASY